MNNPSVSIIIPVYNVEPYVEACIKSVMCQTYIGSIECIVVDDCGTDNSMIIVQKMIAYYNGPVRYKILHHDHNRGLSSARNTGMDAATGDYLFFLDSDDEIREDSIEKLTKPIEKETFDIVVGDMQIIGNNELYPRLKLNMNDKEILRGREIEVAYRIRWKMMAQNKLYRTAFVREQKLRFKEGLIHEDELWSLQIACLAKSLVAVKHFTYLYYVRQGSIISVNTPQRTAKMYMAIVAEMRNFLIGRDIFSVRAYHLIMHFFFQSLKPSLYDKTQLAQVYSQLYKATRFPLRYRIMAGGLNLNTQIKNLLFLLPPKISISLIYWYAHIFNKTVVQ